MNRFLSHDQTKADLTEYLADKILEYNKHSPKLVINSAAGHTRSNKDVGLFSENNHEEADTLMICLGVDATKRNSMDSKMTFFSPDTDVLVLIIANYHLLPEKTSISMTSGTLEIKLIWNALGPDRVKALPAFHAFTGADSTGRFARIAKTSWFKLFKEADDGIVGALSMLGCDNDVTENSLQLTLSSFVCAAYSPKGTNILSIPDLRWHLFCKYMTESERLPPTMGALKRHTLRTHVQAIEYGHRLPFHSRTSLTQCAMVTTRNMMASSLQQLPMSHQHLTLSPRWSGVSVRETAALNVAPASQRTYHAQISVSAVQTAKMIQTTMKTNAPMYN